MLTFKQLVFTVLPLISAVALLPFILSSHPTTWTQRLLSSLSIASLLSTGYLMKFMPLQRPDRKGKRPIRDIEAEESRAALVIKKNLTSLNAGICLILAVGSYWLRARLNSSAPWVVYLVPGGKS